jgi:hypothetical protein
MRRNSAGLDIGDAVAPSSSDALGDDVRVFG